jgi:hypothetical protein
MMKRIRFGFLVVAAVFAQHAFADANLNKPSPSPSPSDTVLNQPVATPFQSESCILSKTDPYDVGEVMHAGDYKGQCMHTEIRRPVVILSEDDQKITIANFYHDKAFWIAEMPKSGIDQVIFQIASFPASVPLIKFAHTQLRFIMKAGNTIKLTPQDTASKLAPTEIDQFNLVDQVTGPKGFDEFEATKGIGPNYGNVLRAMGSLDRAQEELGGNDDTTRQYLLNITDDEKVAAMVNGVYLSAKLGYGDIYKLLSENCTTTAFEILDKSITYKHHVKPFRTYIWNLRDPIEGPSIRALNKRQVIEKELETWNEETGLK